MLFVMVVPVIPSVPEELIAPPWVCAVLFDIVEFEIFKAPAALIAPPDCDTKPLISFTLSIFSSFPAPRTSPCVFPSVEVIVCPFPFRVNLSDEISDETNQLLLIVSSSVME